MTRFFRIQTPPRADSTCVKPGSGHRTFTSLIKNTEWDANDVAISNTWVYSNLVVTAQGINNAGSKNNMYSK